MNIEVTQKADGWMLGTIEGGYEWQAKALPLWSDVRRDQHVFDSIGMDTVIDFCQCPVEIPAKGKPAVFIRL